MKQEKTTYAILLGSTKQYFSEDSFFGGKPKLPPGVAIPHCLLCAAEQTFFFQLAFPLDHIWTGHSLSVFACTSCAFDEYLIPEMLPGRLEGADIPAGFLSEYQRNFRFVVFKTSEGQARVDYRDRVEFRQILLKRDEASNIGFVGGAPVWVLGDESPLSYGSNIPMQFLLQLNSGLDFSTVRDAPRQIEIGLAGDPEPSPISAYQLFLGNTLYFFGTRSPNLHLIYAITQID